MDRILDEKKEGENNDSPASDNQLEPTSTTVDTVDSAIEKTAADEAAAESSDSDPAGSESKTSESSAVAANTAEKTDSGDLEDKQQSPPSPAKPRSFSLLALIALLLAVMAIAAAAYIWQFGIQSIQQSLQGTRAEVSASARRLDAQNTRSRELAEVLEKQAASNQQQLATMQRQVDSLLRQNASLQKRLLSLSTTDRGDWLLAEAEYLIRLANQRLLMGKEIQGAWDLLKAADDITVELDDSGLYNVRQALADNMAALKAAGKFDLEGVYFELAALAKQAASLQLFEMPTLVPLAIESETPDSWQQRFDAGLTRAWHKLSSYIQINRRDEIYKPLLAPEYEAAVRENVQLMFEQAQLAALSGKQRMYQDSLTKAKDWLSNYYTLDQERTESVIATIAELEKLSVEIVLPDISSSLRTLKTYMDMLHSVSPTTPVSTQKSIDTNTSLKPKPEASKKAVANEVEESV